MTSNRGLNSNEALDESTATNSSVMLSGARRVKEAPEGLAIANNSRNLGNCARVRVLCSNSLAQRLISIGSLMNSRLLFSDSARL